MAKLDEVTNFAVKKFSEHNGNAAFDPAIVYLLADMIIQIIQALQACKKDAGGATSMVNDPTLLQRLVLRRTVRNTLDSRVLFNQHGENIISSLLDTGRSLEKTDIEELLSDA